MNKRINPRRPYVISASGLKRIILGAQEGSRDVLLKNHAAAQKTFRSTQPATRNFLVFVHSERGTFDEHAKEVLAAAAILADTETAVVAAVFGEVGVDVGALGADVVIPLAHSELKQYCPAAQLAVAANIIDRYQPAHIFIPDRHADGDFGRRLAARTGRSVATDVIELGIDYAMRANYICHELPQIVLCSRSVANTTLPFIGQGRLEEAPQLGVTLPTSVRDFGIEVTSPDQIGLEESDFILSAGNGMRDLPAFNQLANMLGASVGASRVAVDDGRFSRDKQIGATGKTVQSSIYMALGISGAVQHLQGIKDCRHVIAVNVDASAPIAKRADVMVVEDTQKLMHALIAEVQKTRSASC